MSAVPPTPRVKLRSSSRRVPRQRAAGAGGAVLEVEPEPTMPLSRAILVMLLLHIVAIGGYGAFSLIKERNPVHQASSGALEADNSLASAGSANVHQAEAAGVSRSNVHVVRAGETLTRIANETGVSLAALVAANSTANVSSGLHAGQELRLPVNTPAGTPGPTGAAADALELIEGPGASGGGTAPRAARLPADSGKTYIVGKGDSPVSIAHKLRVSEDALLKLNQIDDPKKLKPGQRLRIPASSKPVAKH